MGHWRESIVSLSIRLFTDDDIPSALDLCRTAGWNQLHQDWSRIIQHEPKGCFVAEFDDQLVGTVTTTRYGTDLAWIGMMLVHQEFRRRGIATDLINASLDYLGKQQVRCIKLDATPAGHGVYERIGFQSEWSFHRWTRDALPSNEKTEDDRGHHSESLTASHLNLDRMAFGDDRSLWLERLSRESYLCQRPDGFGMLRRGYLANYLGPLVAGNNDVAREIVAELLDQSAGTVFWDVPQMNRDATEIASSLGFQTVRDLTRMWTGSELNAPAIKLQYALSDPGTG
jgi:RimJ/RimL family protein N-acetyltransferase